MNRKQVIETLKMENELICFNPLTGEKIPLEYVSDLNRNCYVAHQDAIRLINNSIPIEWLEKCKDRYILCCTIIDDIIEEWREENGKV